MKTTEESPWLDGLVGYHLRRASAVDIAGATKALEATGLRPVPASVLMTIAAQGGSSAADICRALGMQRANIAPILADIERRGFIRRDPDATDSRVQRLNLTPDGTAVIGEMRALLAINEEKVLQALTLPERENLRRLLKKIWKSKAGN